MADLSSTFSLRDRPAFKSFQASGRASALRVPCLCVVFAAERLQKLTGGAPDGDHRLISGILSG